MTKKTHFGIYNHAMISLLSAFFASFIATMLIIRFEHLHNHISADSDLSGPQKFHHKIVPRIGGISIALGILIAVLLKFLTKPNAAIELTLLACAIPVFSIGLLEDLTKKISIRTRLLFTAIGTILAICFLEVTIARLDIPVVDYLLGFSPIAVVFTIFAVTGLSNAYNIIDGFNGLSSMVGIIALMAIGYVSYILADPLMLYLSFVMIAAILGFFVWNFPKGLIFLGDGGAYLIGFWVGMLSILLVSRNPEVSPWFALLINIYPIFETIFSIWRKKIIKKISPGMPDGVHLHMLIYGRITRWLKSANPNRSFLSNARTSPYLWKLSCLATAPAIIFWNNTPALIVFATLFCISYLAIYRALVRFSLPRWLK